VWSVVLSINLLLAGCGIPIAWSIVRANQPGSWKPHWQKLIRLNPVITDLVSLGLCLACPLGFWLSRALVGFDRLVTPNG